MEEYRSRLSEKKGQDVGDMAFFEWIEKYGDAFRKWVESFPERCINCGGCNLEHGEMCVDPFNPKRHEYTENIRRKLEEAEED